MIKLVNVSKFYSSNNVIALGLRKVNLELHRNEFVAIVGESGSGKTTLLNVISGIDSYEDGEMYINGKETSYFSVSDMENYRKKYVAFVFQNYNLIDSYTVLQNVEAPLILSGYPKQKIRTRAKEIIRRVGLEDHMNHKATKLSGGQKQRVVIARALAKDCPIIAADEPTGNLDSESAKQIVELLYEISKEKLVVMVTHDFNQVKDYATRKIRIFDGEIVEDLNLKKVNKLDLPDIPDSEHRIKYRDYLGISLRNLLSVPKKTILMILIFAFFSFFVALAYGAYQIVTDTTTYNYNYYFNNTNPNRVVLRNMDNSAFTEDQLAELENDYDNVRSVVAFDYLLDVRVGFQTAGLDFDYDRDYFSGSYLPLDLIDETMLKFGVMPTADNEVVVSVHTALIDYYEDALPLTVYSNTGADQTSYKIVGMVDTAELAVSQEALGENYFFVTDNTLEELQKLWYFTYILNLEIIGDDETLFFNGSAARIYIDEDLEDNQILTTAATVAKLCDDDACFYDVSVSVEDYYTSRVFNDIELIVTSDYIWGTAFYMNSNTLNAMTYDEVYQVSLLTDKEIGVTSLIGTISRIPGTVFTRQYKVVYPFDSEPIDQFQGLILLLMNIGMIALNFAVMIGSTLITYVIFRAIINTKLHDYAIYRTIGANQGAIKLFIYIENIFVVIVAYIIFLAINLSLPDTISQYGIFYALKVFGFSNYIVFFFMLIVMSLIISRKYSNRIFRNTVQTTLKTSME